MRYDAVFLAGLVVLGLYVESGLLTFVSVVALLLLVVLRGAEHITADAEESAARVRALGTRKGSRASRISGTRSGSVTITTQVAPLLADETITPVGETPLIPAPIPPMGFLCRGRSRDLVLLADRAIVRDPDGSETGVTFDLIRGITFARLQKSAGVHEAAALVDPVLRADDPSHAADAGGVLRIDLGDVTSAELSIAAMMGGAQHDPLAVSFDADAADLFQQAGSWLLARTAPRVPVHDR